MYTNTDATFFRETASGYEPKYLGRVFLDYEKRKNILSTGVSSANSAFFIVPYTAVLLTSFDGSWAFDNTINFTGFHPNINIDANGKNFIVLGKFTEMITGATATEISNNLKAFKADKEIFIVAYSDKKISGTQRVKHYEVGCK